MINSIKETFQNARNPLELFLYVLIVLFTLFTAFSFIYGVIIHGLIISAIDVYRKNKEYDKLNPKRMRKKCLDCKYCKSFKHHPFSRYSKYHNLAVTRLPKFCRKFNENLKYDMNLRCISKLNELAEYE